MRKTAPKRSQNIVQFAVTNDDEASSDDNEPTGTKE